MAQLNTYVSDEMLFDAIEDVLIWLDSEGSTVPEVTQEKIRTLISAAKRNENLSSIEIGTPSKGGAVKAYLDPHDYNGSRTVLENIFMLRQYAQELSSTTDISRKE